MTISSRVSFWINLVLTICSLLASGTVTFTGLLPDPTTHAIVGWAGVSAAILGAINMYLHSYSSSAGSGGTPVTSSKVLGLLLPFLIVGLVLVAFGPSPASAKERVAGHHRALTVKIHRVGVATVQTPDQVVSKILAWAAADGDADLKAAISLATASKDNVTLPCWTALQGFVKQVETLPPADQLPKLHIAVDIEISTDLMIALQPSSPTVAQCQALANFHKMSAVNMVTGIVTGAISIAKLPVPAIP